MSQLPAIKANEFIDDQLNCRLATLEGCFEADVFCIVAGLTYGIDDYTREMIEERRQQTDSHDRLEAV